MSDTTLPTQSTKLWTTPLRDLLRGRITGRLDWKSRIVRAGLSQPAVDLITQVVRRTRLWRLEKAAVADELIAHFLDGLEAGTAADELVAKFGDVRAAAKLIRRAKRRNRPLVWHIWNFAFRVTEVILAIYLLLIVRFCIGRPDPKVDYVARMNEPVLKTPEADRAWPIWEKAILAASDGLKNGQLMFSDDIGGVAEPPPWTKTVDWLEHHGQVMELARQAGQKPVLGVIYGPGGSQDDRQLYQHTFNQEKDYPLVALVLTHLNYTRTIANIMAFDARRAAELNDGARVEADLRADLGLARQLRESDGIAVSATDPRRSHHWRTGQVSADRRQTRGL